MITIHRSMEGKDGKVRVTFSVPAIYCKDCLYLVGWFDEWDESVYRMECTPEGDWSLTLELDPGCEYQYRFRTADGSWLPDPSAPTPPAQFGTNASFVISTTSRDLFQPPAGPASI